MQRARRLAAIAAAAALGVTGLTACGRSAPDVAGYVGNNRFTIERVEALYADAQAKFNAVVEQVRRQQGGDALPKDIKMPITRADIVATLVGLDVLRTVAQQQGGGTPQQLSPQQVADQVGLPAEAEFTRLYAELDSYRQAMLRASQPAELSEQDLRDLYKGLADAGLMEGTEGRVSFEEWSTRGFQPNQRQLVRQFMGLRGELSKRIGGIDAAVNPRYGKSELRLLEFNTEDGRHVSLIVVPLGSDQPAVVDLS